MTGQQPIRVVVADDSVFVRHVLVTKLLNVPDIVVVSTARDGLEAVEQVERLHPDVVTLDFEMPNLDGLGALTEIMARRPCPVIMLSSRTTAGAETTIQALERGAADFVAKPSDVIRNFSAVRDELLAKIRHASRIRASRLVTRLEEPLVPRRPSAAPVAREVRRLVVIGASTGGPRALHQVVAQVEADDRTAFLIVQHMPAGFTKPLADRLNQLSPLLVREAVAGERLSPGVALVAPGDWHLWLDRGGQVELGQGPRLHGVRPALDITLESAARWMPNQVVAAILTGMGSDGTLGAGAVRAAGGYVIAEHESTCVVYGMPRSVVEAGHANEVLPLPEIAHGIARVLETWTKPTLTATGPLSRSAPIP